MAITSHTGPIHEKARNISVDKRPIRNETITANKYRYHPFNADRDLYVSVTSMIPNMGIAGIMSPKTGTLSTRINDNTIAVKK